MSSEGHFINGQWRKGEGPPLVSENPATGDIVWEGRSATPNEVNEAVEAAGKAFDSWADRDISERMQFIEAFREQLIAKREHIAETLSQEIGKPKWEALTEVEAMVGKVALSLEAYHERCRPVTYEISGSLAVRRFKPHGVVAVIGPYNLPGHLPNGHIVPALLAGNTVVFKPSRQAPLVAEVMVQCWAEASLPNGVLNLVQSGPATGTSLATHPGLSGLFFTGSAETGLALHRLYAGQPGKILALEMGGNNPLVVHAATDSQAAAYITVVSAFVTAGQRCTCTRRLIVPQGADNDKFLQDLVSLTKRIKVDNYTANPEPFMGPVISLETTEKLLQAQERLVHLGGRIILEMKPTGTRRTFLTPGIIDVSEISSLPDEEYFGPLLQVIRVPDFASALLEANNTSYGLAAGLLSDDRNAFETFLRRVRAGVINWNRPTTGASSRLPFGGIRGSGNHRPAGYFSADYCSYPVASMEGEKVEWPTSLLPGIESASPPG